MPRFVDNVQHALKAKCPVWSKIASTLTQWVQAQAASHLSGQPKRMKALTAPPDDEKKDARQVKRQASLPGELEPAGPPSAKKPKAQNPQAGQLLQILHRTDEEMLQRPARPEASQAAV